MAKTAFLEGYLHYIEIATLNSQPTLSFQKFSTNKNQNYEIFAV